MQLLFAALVTSQPSLFIQEPPRRTLRVNLQILRAIRATYAYVFMDEFQDTTHVQYDLVKTAFLESQTILTAVGDNKQQIMRWAMALDDPFGAFENDF